MRPARWTARGARLTALVLVLMLHPAAARGPDSRESLAAELRGLYAPPNGPEERWRRRATVRLADGREVERSLAYRDEAGFVAAASWLVESREHRIWLVPGAWGLEAGRPMTRRHPEGVRPKPRPLGVFRSKRS